MLDVVIALTLNALKDENIQYLKKKDMRPQIVEERVFETSEDILPTITDDGFMQDKEIQNKALTFDAIKISQENLETQEKIKKAEAEDIKKGTLSSIKDKVVEEKNKIVEKSNEIEVKTKKEIDEEIKNIAAEDNVITSLDNDIVSNISEKSKDVGTKVVDIAKENIKSVDTKSITENITNIGTNITDIAGNLKDKVIKGNTKTIDDIPDLVIDPEKKEDLKDVKVVEIKAEEKKEEEKKPEKIEIVRNEVVTTKEDIKSVEDTLKKEIKTDELPKNIEQTFSREIVNIDNNEKTEKVIDSTVGIPKSSQLIDSKLEDLVDTEDKEKNLELKSEVETNTKKDEKTKIEVKKEVIPPEPKIATPVVTLSTTTPNTVGNTSAVQPTTQTTATETSNATQEEKEEEVVVQYKEDINYKNYLSEDDKKDLELVLDKDKPPPNIIPRKKVLKDFVEANLPPELISDERNEANSHIPMILKNIDMQEMAKQAIDEDNIDILRAVLETTEDPNYILDNRESILSYACSQRRYRIIYYLLYIGADINKKDQKKNTPLHAAVKSNDLEAVKIMLERNADLNTRDALKNTPLHTAIEKGYTKIATLLIEAGASLDLMNAKKDTPLDTAKKYQRKNIEVLILKKTGKL